MDNFQTYRQEAHGIYEEGLKRVVETPEPEGQKFHIGEFVWITKDLPASMSHFPSNRSACIQYTYQHAYGASDRVDPREVSQYSLLVRHDDGTWHSNSWYDEDQLSLVQDFEQITRYKREIIIGGIK